MANPKHTNALDNRSLVALSNFITSDDDGVKFINIDKSGKTELGRKLSPTAPVFLRTPFGKVGTVRSFMEAITVKGYDLRLLGKGTLTRQEMASIPKEKVNVPNYWACVAYILCERIFKDQALQKLMKENELPYECFSGAKKNMLYGNEVWTARTNRWLSKYVGIIRLITNLIKEGKWNKEEAEKLINSCKEDPNKDVFDSITIALPKPQPKEVVSAQPETVTRMNVPGNTLKI